MRARVLFTGLMAISTLAIAGPAAAKAAVAEASITGPGLGGGLRIEAPDTGGVSGFPIDLAGGLADTRTDSVEELGLTSADLGPRYLVTYRFALGRGSNHEPIRQELYPYTEDGPVTYTPPGQGLKSARINMSITAGWYHSLPDFFHYLVVQGLPETNPLASGAARQTDPDTASGAQTVPWMGIVVVIVGLAALSLAALAVRRRTPAVGRVNR